jgi:hypothetical protein
MVAIVNRRIRVQICYQHETLEKGEDVPFRESTSGFHRQYPQDLAISRVEGAEHTNVSELDAPVPDELQCFRCVLSSA